MCGGNAVITTRQNGAAEVLPGEMLMDGPDDETILHVLERLLGDPDYLAKIKQENLETVAVYTIEKNATETIALIEQTLQEMKSAD
jgi:hypothetical protein